MRSAASRLHKGFSFAKRFQGCSDWICCDGAAWAGRWNAWAPGGAVRGKAFSHVVLDLGCGKGEYTVACAKLRPDVLFVGFDVDAVCTLRAAEAASAVGVDNAVFLMDGVPSFEEHPEQAHASRASEGRAARSGAPAEIDLSTVFAVGELSALLMNFPTPFPKKKKAHYRLTHFERLMSYRPLLAPGAFVRLRTDSMPLRDFSLTQFEIAGYDVQWNTDDVRGMFPNEPWSGYEHKLVAQGAPVCGFAAVPGPAPENPQQTAPLSLVSYLPEDIEDLAYVPHGMQGCVENMKGRRANRRAKGLSEWTRPII